ncbi:MAG: hypothetical protein JW750_07910, partial [Anaerolineaceae bacterium]|nr:hypothetical protein [Anaerolineaceae bacterium]
MCEQMVTLPYPEIMRFLREACDGETRLYLVGGAVRDLILKRPLHDLDFVLERQVRRISRQAANAFKGDFYLLDAERNTARVLLPQENTAPLILDFAEQRGDSLLDDLTDRDFTINAIALDLLPEAPEWVDPLRGRDDLAAHVLRACSPRTFELDPLRILRAIRMQLSFGLSFAPDLEGLISGSIDQLPLVSAERARDELFKLFDSRPTDAVKSMDAMGVLAKLMPETLRMKGVEQSPPHQHDVWQHTMCMLQHLEQLIELLDSSEVGAGLGAPQREYLKVIRPYADRLRAYLEIQLSGGRNLRSMLFFAAFFHDLGKVDTQFEDEHGRIRAFGHERLSAELLDQRAERLALSNVERKFLAAVVGGHMRVHHLTEAAKL